MPTAPTGTVTLLFSDIERSTRLLQHLGDRYAAVLTAHQQLLRAAFLRFALDVVKDSAPLRRHHLVLRIRHVELLSWLVVVLRPEAVVRLLIQCVL